MSYVGLQSASKHSVARIKNVTAQSTKTLSDTLLAQALDLFPAGIMPDAIFMNRRSRSQLQAARAATISLQTNGRNGSVGAGAVYTPTPLDFSMC